MPGRTLQVLRKSFFDFSRVQDGEWIEVYYPPLIDTSQFIEGTLVVRVHRCVLPSGSSIYINAYPRAPTPDDPEFDLAPGDLVVFTGLVFDDATVAPALKLRQITGRRIPGALVIIVGASQSTPAATFTAVLSIDLVMKS